MKFNEVLKGLRDKAKKFWSKLTLASKIAFIFWTLDAFYMLFSGESNVRFIQWFVIWIFGYFFFVGIVQLISKRKSKKEKGIKALSSDEPLPVIIASNILLSADEVCHYSQSATYVKTKNVVVGYSGGSRGTTVRVAKGVSFRVGASKAAPVRSDVQERTNGILSITNKRVIFSADKGAFDKKISSLSAITPYKNGIAFQFGEHQYPLETKESEYIYQILNRIIESSHSK